MQLCIGHATYILYESILMLTGLDDTLNQNDCVYSIVFNLI